MVNSTILIIGFVLLIATVGAILVFSRSSTSAKVSNVPQISDILRQVDLPVNPTNSTIGAIGFAEGKVNADSAVDDIKSNILTNNLLTEEAIRKIVADEQDKVQISTITAGGTQTREVKGIELFRSPDSSLIVQDAFAPVGEGEFLGIRGTPLAEDAIARTQETFSGTITTPTGGTRQIQGSKALFDRLQSNLLKSQG